MGILDLLTKPVELLVRNAVENAGKMMARRHSIISHCKKQANAAKC